MLKIVVRVGDQDDYHAFDDIRKVAEYLATCDVEGDVRCYYEYAACSDNFIGNNYISLFWGKDIETPVRELSAAEFSYLNGRLNAARKEMV